MATLQKIRNRAGLLIAIVIGIALLAFVLGDFLNTGKRAMRRSETIIAEIDGKSIYIQEYNKIENSVSEIYKMNSGQQSMTEQMALEVKNQVWQELLDKYIMQKEYEKIGLAVHSDELFDMVQGSEPHYIVKQFFTNPETNEFNKTALMNFLRAVNSGEVKEDEKHFWLYIEDQIKKERINSKFNTLFNKGIYNTSFNIKNDIKDRDKKVTISFVARPINSVPDSAVKITSKDMENYYAENKDKYEVKEETRNIQYVTFTIIPSEEDDKEANEWINDLKPEFEEISDVERYVNYNSSEPYSFKNYTKEELPEIYRDEIFNAPVGTVYGPFFENNAYKLVKLARTDYLPDSVRARHILLQPTQQKDLSATKAEADSIMDLIKKGASFSGLAVVYSKDGSAQDGGDLGWFTDGKMVKPFNDTCFYGKKGDLKLVESRYGIHIIEITDQSRKVKKVQLGTIVRPVEASQKTIQKYYSEAVRFAGMNHTYNEFSKAVNGDPKMQSIPVNYIKIDNQEVYGIPQSRNIVRWAFEADVNDISEVFEFNDMFVVAALTKVNEKGIPSLDEVKEDIKFNLIAQKKGEKIKEDLQPVVNNNTSLEDIAANTNMQIKQATDISFGNAVAYVRDAGVEPKLVALATVSDKGMVVGPVIGNNSVYILRVDDIKEPSEISDAQVMFMKSNMYSAYNQAGLRNEAQTALKEITKIKDKRSKFF